MFVCEGCHAGRCQWEWIESMHLSRGPCERCKKVANCLDCQGYKLLPPPRTMTGETP